MNPISSVTPIRVRYAETDQMKLVYYGKYFEFFESGRSDLLRSIGLPYPEIERLGFYLPVIEAHARYIRSAKYDNLLHIKTILRERPQARIRIEYEVTNGETGDILAEGYTVHSFVNAASGRPTRVPTSLLNAIDATQRQPVHQHIPQS